MPPPAATGPGGQGGYRVATEMLAGGGVQDHRCLFRIPSILWFCLSGLEQGERVGAQGCTRRCRVSPALRPVAPAPGTAGTALL